VPNRLRKLRQADLDLDSIWSFIAADSVRAADGPINRIGEVFEMLLQNPLAGRARPELRQDLRSSPVGNYVIFYSGRQDINADDMA
jgi:toxin ParE1/3/4